MTLSICMMEREAAILAETNTYTASRDTVPLSPGWELLIIAMTLTRWGFIIYTEDDFSDKTDDPPSIFKSIEKGKGFKILKELTAEEKEKCNSAIQFVFSGRVFCKRGMITSQSSDLDVCGIIQGLIIQLKP